MNWPRRVKTAADAVKFIDAAGYCLLFPIKKTALPSLYYAMARRATLDWDAYGAKLWEWKDNIPRRRRAFYSKYFRGRGTFISLKLLPHFLAMEGTGAVGGDHARMYAAGRISADACAIWETLDAQGPLATLELRHACKMGSKAGNKRYKRAMLELSRALVVVHSGTEQETGAWASSRFELTARAFPKQAAAARKIAREDARAIIAAKYLECYPSATPRVLARLFRWTKAEALAASGKSGE